MPAASADPPGEPTIYELLVKLKNDDDSAADWLYPRLFRLWYRNTRTFVYRKEDQTRVVALSHEEAEDAIHDAFEDLIKGIRTLDEGRSPGEVRGWLAAIHRNAVISFLRKSRKASSIDDPGNGSHADEIEDETESEDAWVRRIAYQQAWERLGAEDQAILKAKSENPVGAPSRRLREARRRFWAFVADEGGNRS